MIEIKNRFNGKTIIRSRKKTIREVVEYQVRRGANLRDANLEGAYLDVKTPPVNSHQFVSEILSRKSITETQLDFSARIRLQTDQCWEYFIRLAKNKKVSAWAKTILFRWEEFKDKFIEEQ